MKIPIQRNSGLSCLVFLMFLGLCSIDVFPCSMARLPEPPIAMVSPNTYILVGEVVGYTELISDPGNFRGSAVGLKLKPLVTIQFPHNNASFVELFMFGHGSDCFPEPMQNKPAIGTRLRLSLPPATLVGSFSRGSNTPRIQSQVFDRVDIDEQMFGFSTDAYTEFDYKNDLKTLYDKFSAPARTDKRRWLDDFLAIETAKDLIRLKKAILSRAQDQRLQVLERLLYNPKVNYALLFSLNSDVFNQSFFRPDGIPVTLRIEPEELSDKVRARIAKKEKELLAERKRLESSGEVSFWKR